MVYKDNITSLINFCKKTKENKIFCEKDIHSLEKRLGAAISNEHNAQWRI